MRFTEGVDPLTGLKVENPELLKRRPVLVKVANYPAEGRPHTGLSYADIVFEYYIGGGSNRFNAVYYGQDCNKVGPRCVLEGWWTPELTRMYQGVLAMSGANQENVFPRITELLGDRVITEGNCHGLCRDDYTVMGVFANTADITNVMRAKGVQIENPDLTGMLLILLFLLAVNQQKKRPCSTSILTKVIGPGTLKVASICGAD